MHPRIIWATWWNVHAPVPICRERCNEDMLREERLRHSYEDADSDARKKRAVRVRHLIVEGGIRDGSICGSSVP